MALHSLGFMEILVLIVGMSGLPANDLASLLPLDDYFASRKVTVNASEMMALAGKESSSPKGQLQQLLAIRWLGENADATKKVEGRRVLLEDIASGKKGEDRHGFARRHARRALALLDGKTPPPLSSVPSNSLRGQGLSWFPATITFAGGYEFRADRHSHESTLAALRKLIALTVRQDERRESYSLLESMGNIAFDRISFAARSDESGEPQQWLVRLTVTGDTRRIADTLASAMIRKDVGPPKLEEHKGPKGEKATVAVSAETAFALIGDSDLLFLIDRKERKPLLLLDDVLAVKAGDRKALSTGRLGNLLEQAPAAARLLFVMDVPERMRKQATSDQGSPFRAFPERILAYSVMQEKLTLTVQGTLANKSEAEEFKEALVGLRQKGLQALNDAPPRVTKEAIKRFKETLEGIKLEADRNVVKGRLTLDPEAMKAIVELLFARPMLEERP